MTDMTQDQIKREFERQVRLCSGLGLGVMLEIVQQYFEKKLKEQANESKTKPR